MTSIWALFSVDNNYDQPPCNLVAWWPERPTMDLLEKIVSGNLAARLLLGLVVRDSQIEFRLRQIEPGEMTEGWL